MFTGSSVSGVDIIGATRNQIDLQFLSNGKIEVLQDYTESILSI